MRLEFKKDAIIATNLARNIGEYIALAVGGKDSKVEITPPWDLYPGLFNEEKEANDKKVSDEEWEDYKARRAGFVQRYNKSFKKEVKKDEQLDDGSRVTSSSDSEVERVPEAT